MSAAVRTTIGDDAQAPDLAGIVRAAQDRLTHAVQVGQLRDDPLSAVLEAIGVSLDAQLRLHDANIGQMREAQKPLDPAALVRLEEAAATGADRRATALARAHNWRTLTIAAVVLVASVASAGVGGYWAGRQSQIITATALTDAAFRSGPAAAELWLRLMQANDGNAVVKTCAETTTKPDGSNRACGLGLWLDPAPRPLPRTAAGPK